MLSRSCHLPLAPGIAVSLSFPGSQLSFRRARCWRRKHFGRGNRRLHVVTSCGHTRVLLPKELQRSKGSGLQGQGWVSPGLRASEWGTPNPPPPSAAARDQRSGICPKIELPLILPLSQLLDAELVPHSGLGQQSQVMRIWLTGLQGRL